METGSFPDLNANFIVQERPSRRFWGFQKCTWVGMVVSMSILGSREEWLPL